MSKEKESTTNQSNMCKKDYLYLTRLREALWICYLPVSKSNVHRSATLQGDSRISPLSRDTFLTNKKQE